MNSQFFQRDRDKFMDLMDDNSVAVFFSGGPVRDTADQFFPFSVDRNFYYFTGIPRENMVLMMSKLGGTTDVCLFIPPVDELYEKWHARFVRKDEATECSGIDNVQYTPDFEGAFAKKVYTAENVPSLYLYSNITELDEPEDRYRRFAQVVARQFPTIRIQNSQPIMSALRSVKEPEEIAQIQEAVSLTGEALSFVMQKLRPGIYEYEIAAHYHYQLALRNSRPRHKSVIASGQNAMMLHYNAGTSQVEAGQLVLMDVGAYHNWYASDITRTYPVSGRFTPRQKDVYNVVLEAQEVAMAAMRDGVAELSVNQAVKQYFAKELRSLKLISDDSEVERYFYHSIGHQIGLDLHDLRSPGRVLRENSVYTVEPGLYIAEEGIGIRIEENVVVTKTGVRCLSGDIIKTVADIENYMG
ncbi:MAG: aminopeptidase P N-terminal domain-containing protein [Bacillota bacterium]